MSDSKAREAAARAHQKQMGVLGGDPANAAIDAYIAALGETHAIVPREPTEAMIFAGILERHDQPCPEAWSLATENIYRAMLNAAEPQRTEQT